MHSIYENPNNTFLKNDNAFKLYIIGTIFFFFGIFLRINSLEKRIISLKESLESTKGKLIIENNAMDKNNSNKEYIDKDLIGLSYPEIEFEELKNNISYMKKLINDPLIRQFNEFLTQLEIKLIYLEKEINVTKLFTFYSIRTNYLKNYNVEYNDENITELHNIINWEVIHRSNQLKGIASDKYLVCKYAKIKLGEDLCQQRIRAYDSVEEIDFEKLVDKGNIVLKITNGCHDLVFIRQRNILNKTKYIDLLKKKVKYYFQRDFGLSVPEFFHLYSKKRIIEETIFEPKTDLFEFKFFVVNRDIKFFMVYFHKENMLHKNFYEPSYKILNFSEIMDLDIISMFGIEILNKLKDYAYRLSEDFPNFIRVDLFVFHKNIYLSELTFDSVHGIPYYANKEIIINAGKNYTKYE